MLNICAVVVTFNRKELLCECISSLLSQTYPLSKIYVIDNNSTDGTYDLLKSKGYFQNEQIVYEKLPENIGGAGGFSHGLKKAFAQKHDFYYILDDDAEPQLDAIENLAPYLTQDYLAFASAVYSNGILHETTHRGIFDFCDIYPTPQKAIPLQAYEDETIEIEMASFVGLLLSYAAIEKIGFPRAEFFIHFDDTEYCIRLSKISKILMIPQSIIDHKEKRQEEKIEKQFLWFKKKRIRYDKLWIKYYGRRNSVHLAMKYSTCKLKTLTTIFFEYCSLIKDILIYDDNKYKRMWFSSKSYKDGLHAYFENTKPQILLKGIK